MKVSSNVLEIWEESDAVQYNFFENLQTDGLGPEDKKQENQQVYQDGGNDQNSLNCNTNMDDNGLPILQPPRFALFWNQIRLISIASHGGKILISLCQVILPGVHWEVLPPAVQLTNLKQR